MEFPKIKSLRATLCAHCVSNRICNPATNESRNDCDSCALEYRKHPVLTLTSGINVPKVAVIEEIN